MVKYGEFYEKVIVDQENQAWLAKFEADPSAELIEAGIASDLTLP